MKRYSLAVLLVSIFIALIMGGIAGFFVGVASSRIGEQLIDGMVETEQTAKVSKPQELKREKFRLQYPANWKIDTQDEDYDPDQMFTIESPGSTFVMFIIGESGIDPEENIREQIDAFSKLMGTPKINRFEKWGQFTGKGAQLNGRIMGSRSTVKAFSFSRDDMTVIIVEQYPDADFKLVEEGISLIEESFSLTSETAKDQTPDSKTP